MAGLRQEDVAVRAGISQVRVSELERGLGQGGSIETWAMAAAAVGEQLVGFFERAPGATPPRDIEHLRRQVALIEFARAGGWSAIPELAIDQGAVRSRSVDVALLRPARREAVEAEIWDWFDDVGSSLRSLDNKRNALAARLDRDGDAEGPGPRDPAWKVRCLFVVRRTRRNVELIRELRPLFAARFKAPGRAWLRALSDPTVELPAEDGLLWSTARYALQASRLAGPE